MSRINYDALQPAGPDDGFVPVAEAAYLAALSDKQLQRLVDERVVDETLIRTASGRLFSRLASAFAKFYFESERVLTADARKEAIKELTDRVLDRADSDHWLSLDSPLSAVDWTVLISNVAVDLNPPVKAVQHRAEQLAHVERMISIDEGVAAGAPVFKGTRVPIDTVLGLKRKGVPMKEIVQDYPTISEELIAAAETYRLVHPKRGRPATGASLGWKMVSTKAISRKK